jgi:hypothetical protein
MNNVIGFSKANKASDVYRATLVKRSREAHEEFLENGSLTELQLDIEAQDLRSSIVRTDTTDHPGNPLADVFGQILGLTSITAVNAKSGVA